ncbi:hypothetical protein [Thermococcus sp. 9N3]|uniref:hypothetical protein n=1 Tax=Thermococcus sp. 9N3 TaxID=163002 RepID=UPI003211D20B
MRVVMKRWLKLFGIVLFTIGFVLAATYDRPNCSGIACPFTFPAIELKANSGNVFVWPPNATPPNVTYDANGGYFVFLSDYFVPLREFYLKVSGMVGFNVSGTLTIFPGRDFRELEATYIDGTLHVGDTLYRGHIRGILVENGTRIRTMAVYDDPASYFEFKNCTEHYREIVEACRASGSPEYQLPLGVGLMVLGFGLFWLGMKL